jgi:hypothetical protein
MNTKKRINVKDDIKKRHIRFKHRQPEVTVKTSEFNFEDDPIITECRKEEKTNILDKIILSIKI